jgi:hypothetical protein
MKIDPGLDKAYRFLLSTFAGPTAPDVVTPFRENTIGTKIGSAHGDHGGLNWGAQHIKLVMSGPGVRRGVVSHYPARLIDIAPTALHVLGLTPPASMDGTILADALLSPEKRDQAKQSALAPTLAAYQDALMQQSSDNMAEDVAKQIRPPGVEAARP